MRKRWMSAVLALLCLIGWFAFSPTHSLTQTLPPERKVRKIEFTLHPQGFDPVRYDWILMVIKNWEKLGVDVEIKPIDGSLMATRALRTHEFDANTLSWGGAPERIDPDYFIYTILDSAQAGPSLYNVDGYNNPEYDKLARRQRVTLDPEERRKIVFRAQEIFAHDQPETPVVHKSDIQGYNNADFKNFVSALGEGLASRWNLTSVIPTGSRKVLRYGYPRDIQNLNPMKIPGIPEIEMLRILYDTLMVVNPEGKLVPWAAKEAKVVDDRTIDVMLREGMTFHDGKAVTADDVKFTFDYLRKWKIGPFAAALLPLETVEKTGNLSVRFKLKEPSASFLSYTLSYVYIFPKHIWENIPEKVGVKQPDEWTDWKAMVGSGPFKFDYLRPEEMKLLRHEGHFSNPKIEGFLRVVFGDVQGMVMSLQKREIDMTGRSLSPLQAQTLKSQKHITLVTVPDLGFFPIHYNCRVKPFSDVAFRRALAYCVPKKRIVEEFYEGYAQEAHSTISPMNKYWYNPNVEKFDLDMDKARKILKDAGYEWDNQGKLHYPKGK